MYIELDISYLCGGEGVFNTEREDQNFFHTGEDQNFFHNRKGGPVFFYHSQGGTEKNRGSSLLVKKMRAPCHLLEVVFVGNNVVYSSTLSRQSCGRFFTKYTAQK